MVVCRYFMQGYCRFGANCRNEHTDGYYSQGNRQYRDGGVRGDNRRTDNYHWQKGGGGGGGGVGGGNSSDVERIAQAIREEIISIENGNMWPLTCFAPIVLNGNLKGWEDYSPEEIRLEMLSAFHSGTLDNYDKTLEALYNSYREKRKKLKITNRETLEEIREYLKSTSEAKNGFASNSPSVFQSSNNFGNSETAKNFSFAAAFSSSAQQPQSAASSFSFSQAFNQPGSAFGGQSSQPGSVFGGQPTQSGSVFGSQGSQSSSIFGGSSKPSGATFGQSQAPQSGSVFDQNQPTQNFGQAGTPSVFGQNQLIQGFGPNQNGQGTASVFGQNQLAQSFAQNQNGQATSSFAQNQTSIFGNSAPPNQSVFNQPFFNANPQSNVASSTPFSQNTGFQQGTGGSVFGQNNFQQGANSFSAHTQAPQFGSFVGGANNQSGGGVSAFPSMPPSSTGPSFSVYSPIDALSQEEISAYQAQTFTFKGIPLNAPSENLCH